MSANPRVMKPQKYDAANVMRSEVKVGSAKSLVRAYYMRNSLGSLCTKSFSGTALPMRSVPHCRHGLTLSSRPSRGDWRT
jgi:hypothetical protein